uniref:Uncharacterized protein n=1 Tax=Clastoptera arizonana TaxID=38151 RepID=A0A1B6CMP3_9HEMI
MTAVAILVFVLVAAQYSSAEENMKMAMVKEHMTKCAEELKISPEDLDKMQKHELPESEINKCFPACIMEKMKLMENGVFNEEAVDKMIEEVFKGDEENKKKAMENTKACGDLVEEKKIEDRCEKAFTVMKCLKEKKGLFMH